MAPFRSKPDSQCFQWFTRVLATQIDLFRFVSIRFESEAAQTFGGCFQNTLPLRKDMSHLNSHLETVFSEAFSRLTRKPVPAIEVKFYPYAGLHHTIRVRSGRVHVRLSDVFKIAPPEVFRALAFILVARLLSRKPPVSEERIYRAYAFRPEVIRASDIARRERGRKRIHSAQGHVYDLEKIFARLNRAYFDGEMERPTLTWSRRRARNILGHHNSTHNTITISRALDSPDVPEWFVEYIMFHEMLHVKHPARLINGRRRYHTAAFRADEHRFRRYDEAQAWLDNVVRERQELRARAA